MTERPNRTNQIRRAPPLVKSNPASYRRPFWLPASNYYILAAAVAIASFFLIWGILHDGDEAPWIPAGIGASMILMGAVFLREIVLRKARNRYLLVQRRLDYTLDTAAALHAKVHAPEKKLTLEKNAEIIKQIQKKSDAAKVLMKLSEGHHEVFELCGEYLEINRQELETVGAGSPRLAGLRRGREIVSELHRFHLMAWVEIEARQLTQEAKNRVTIIEKTETAQKALSVIQTALQYYPEEPRLIESEDAVRGFVTSIRVSHFVEQAERSAFKGNYKRAVSHYKDALFFLAREGSPGSETDLLAAQINSEIQKIHEISSPSKNLGTRKKRND